MKVYLSYSQSERTLADQLRFALAMNGFEVANAPEKLAAGANWHKQMGKALEQSDAMIVLLTPDAISSGYVRSEIDYALSNPRFRDRLIPVLVSPTQVPWILEKLNRPIIHASSDAPKTARQIVSALEKSSLAQMAR